MSKFFPPKNPKDFCTIVFSQEIDFLQQLALDTLNAVLTTESKYIATSPVLFAQSPKIIKEITSVSKKYVFPQEKLECSFDKGAKKRLNL